jgi:hypothetical protein
MDRALMISSRFFLARSASLIRAREASFGKYTVFLPWLDSAENPDSIPLRLREGRRNSQAV